MISFVVLLFGLSFDVVVDVGFIKCSLLRMR